MLQRLRLDAGNPSYREIARLADRNVSPAKAHNLFTNPKVPRRWNPCLSAVIAALGGDEEEAFEIWKAAWLAQEGGGTGELREVGLGEL